MSEEKRVTTILEGTIMAVDWDEDNHPIEVSIETEEGVEAYVELSEEAEGLLELDGAEVKVFGVLDASDPEYVTMFVDSYEVVDDPYADYDEFEEVDDDRDLYSNLADFDLDDVDEDEDESSERKRRFG